MNVSIVLDHANKKNKDGVTINSHIPPVKACRAGWQWDESMMIDTYNNVIAFKFKKDNAEAELKGCTLYEVLRTSLIFAMEDYKKNPSPENEMLVGYINYSLYCLQERERNNK